MSSKCINHIMKNIIFLRILNQVVITSSDLNFARILCDEFMIEFIRKFIEKKTVRLLTFTVINIW